MDFLADKALVERERTENLNKPKRLIKFVGDRPGHDFRYSLNCEKIKELGWRSRYKIEKAMKDVIRWYKENE